MAAPKERPPRAWEITDLQALGSRGKVTYLKAVPVLILEKWVREGKNYIRTTELAERIVSSGLRPPFKAKGTSNLLGALGTIQKSRNLTDPPLMDNRRGESWVTLPHYEQLLQEYRQWYCQEHSDDYGKLFSEGEPDWERRTPSEPEIQDEIRNLFATLEQTLRELQQTVERLTEENQRLQAQLSFVHTSPDYHNSLYGGKVTSIKDTIRDMLQRARHSIRISTRQMDMFGDELIALKRRDPDLKITVLSRGPEGAKGERRHLAGVALERMKRADIKLPIEKVVLHSRMVVIDDQEVLVSSADLDVTQMEMEFNAGIWTDNPDVVAEAIRYFDNLLKSPTVKGLS